MSEAFSSRMIGGIVGLEILEKQDWEEILETLVKRARDSTRAKPFVALKISHPFPIGRLTVLDPEAAGTLAHELAHFLETDVHNELFLRMLVISK
ncbi:MAG: hypothetical protein ACUVQ0_04440 [Thermoproteota archaeon]